MNAAVGGKVDLGQLASAGKSDMGQAALFLETGAATFVERALMGKQAFFPTGQKHAVEFETLCRMQGHDHIGDGYTLLCLGGARANTGGLAEAFASFGAPFSLVEIDEDRPRDIFGHDFLLLRPDLHVVWRGNRLSADPAKLAALATGH